MLSRVMSWIYEDDTRYGVYMIGKLLLIGVMLVAASWMIAVLVGVTLPNMERIW